MKLLNWTLSLSFATLVSLGSLPAFADQADKDACVGLQEGDDCTRGDGGPGLCLPDASDPGILTCDDDPSTSGSGGDDSGNGGCSTSGPAPSALPFALLGLTALALRRRAH